MDLIRNTITARGLYIPQKQGNLRNLEFRIAELVMETMNKIPNSNYSLTTFLNPIWKALARHLTNECEKCGQERLLSVFDDYLLSRHLCCESCLLTSTAISPLIRLLFFYLGVNNSTVRQLLKTRLSAGAC